ncbi:MAG: hypothetical protein ACQEQY_01265 [Halobacteriota archaeon]
MSDDEADEPLEDLVREVESRTGDGDGDRSNGETADDEPRAKAGERPSTPDERPADTRDRPSDPEPGRTDADDGPLGDLRRAVESRSGTEGVTGQDETDRESAGAGAVDDDHFAEMDVEDVGADEVWADLLFDDGGPTEGAFPATEHDAGDDGPGQVVTKRLCHRCEYFGDPPTLHCTHEGTSIEELVGMDHYRVTDCPMVADDYDERDDDS